MPGPPGELPSGQAIRLVPAPPWPETPTAGRARGVSMMASCACSENDAGPSIGSLRPDGEPRARWIHRRGREPSLQRVDRPRGPEPIRGRGGRGEPAGRAAPAAHGDVVVEEDG